MFQPVAPPLAFTATVTGTRPLNALQTIGRGAAFLDANQDGYLDLLLIAPQPVLLLGDGKGRFAPSTLLPPLQQEFIGCAVGDYDGDGYADIYLSGYRAGALLHNEVGKGFRDVTAASGITPQPFGTACAWAETVPGSGRLDLVVANYARFGADQGQPLLCDSRTADGKVIQTSCPPRQYTPLPAVLFRNQGGGHFRKQALPTTGRGLGVAVADPEGKGQPLITFANDEIMGDLLEGGPEHWNNIAVPAGTAYDCDGNVHGGMGTDWGDYDNDGKLDLVVSTFHNELKSLYRCTDSKVFTDLSPRTGIGAALRPYVAFGVKFLDADNDGWLDLIFANGHVQDNIQQIDLAQHYRQPSVFLHNEGGKQFRDLSGQACPALTKPIVGRGVAVGDYDNDGRMDVLIGDMEGTPLLLHNESPVRNWVGFVLEGSRSNRAGIGARVSVVLEGRTLVRHCHTDGSYLTASDPRVHFGLGESSQIKRVEVLWPSGKRQSLTGIERNRYNTVQEPR